MAKVDTNNIHENHKEVAKVALPRLRIKITATTQPEDTKNKDASDAELLCNMEHPAHSMCFRQSYDLNVQPSNH